MSEAASLAEAGSTERAVEKPARDRALATHAPILALGLLVAFHLTLLSRFRLLQGDVGDPRLNNFILEHGYRWLLSKFTLHSLSLWSPPFFFPAENVGAYSEILLGSGPIYWLFRTFGFAADTSLQLWTLSVVILDYVSMAVFLRACFGFRQLGAALGAFLFAFGSPRIAQIAHQQLLPQFFTVFALHGLYRFFRPARISARQGLALFAVAFAAQFWAGFYLGWFLFLALLLGTLWATIFPRYRAAMLHRLVEYRASFVVAVAVIVALLLPMAIPYFRALREVGPRPSWSLGLIHPQSWFYLGPQSWLYGWLQRLPMFQALSAENEQRIGIGWSTLGLASFGFYAFMRRRGWPRIAFLSGLTMIAVMTHYPGGFTAWPFFARLVPAGSAIRALPRVALLLLIPFSIGLAEVVEAIKLRTIALIVCIVAIAEQAQATDAYDKTSVRADVAAIAAQVKNSCEAFYYVATCPGLRDRAPPIVKVQVDAMAAALETAVPTVNGYSGNFPFGWWDLVDARLFDKEDAVRLHEALHRWLMRQHADSVQVCWIESPTCR
jgi:hypothetical protein